MSADADALARQILAIADFEDLRALLEAQLAADEQRPDLLYALRALAYDEEASWRTMLTAARMSPLPVAISAHTHGRQLNLHKGWSASLRPLQIARAAYDWADDDDGAARAGATLADSLYICGDYEAARTAARRAESCFARANKYFETGKCRLTIASAYADQLDPGRARGAFEAAIASLRAAGDQHPHVAVALTDAYIGLGSMLEKLLDDFEGAARAYALAATTIERIRDQLTPEQLAYTLFRLHIHQAITDLRLGRHTNARRALDQAEAFLPHDDDLNHFEIRLYRGYQALLLGDAKGARRLLDLTWRQARRLADDQPTSLHNRFQEQQVRAAMCAGLSADLPPDQALDLMDQALALCAQLEIQLWPALIVMGQAQIAYTAGRYAEARAYLGRARVMLGEQNEALSRRYLDLEVVRAIYDPAADLDALRRIAEALRGVGDHAARAEVLKTLGRRLERDSAPDDAYQSYLASIDAVEQARSALRIGPQSIPFLATRRLAHERAFALAAEHDPSAAFEIGERARAQALLDELANGGEQMLLDRDDPRLERLRTLRAALERAHARTAQLTPLFSHAGAFDETPEQRAERQQIEQRYAEELLALQAAGSDEAAWMRGQVADLPAIRQMLGPDAALVAYLMVGRPEADRRDAWACVLTAHGPTAAINLASYRDVDLFLRQWQETAFPSCDLETANGLLARLHKLFLGPLADLLKGCARLILIPDETLPLLPLHAARSRDGSYLVERHSVSYAPSASVLLHCLRRERERPRSQGVFLGGWAGEDAARLAQVERELSDLAALLRAEPQHRSFEVADILDAIGRAGLVHLACHGVFPRDSAPIFAHLAIGRAAKLYAHDLYSRSLRADLLTFSACDTGQHGPGLQGLTSAALVSGASATLASMWPADDRATRALMRAFYAALAKGSGRAEALRSAQCEMIRDPQFAAPALWAPFFLTGAPGALPD